MANRKPSELYVQTDLAHRDISSDDGPTGAPKTSGARKLDELLVPTKREERRDGELFPAMPYASAAREIAAPSTDNSSRSVERVRRAVAITKVARMDCCWVEILKGVKRV